MGSSGRPWPDPHSRRTRVVLSLLHPHKEGERHGPLTSHRPRHRRRRSRHRRGFSQCADHRAGEPAAADAAGPGRHRSRAAQHSDRNAEPRHLRSPADRSRHGGEPQVSVLGLAHAARAWRLDPPGHRTRARHLQGDRRRRHAAQHRRRARAALAQGRRVGLHDLRPRPHHRGRRGGPPVRRRCRRRRPLVLPQGHPALHSGARPRRLRVPAGVRRRQLLRGQHLPAQRLVQARAARRARQELRCAGVELRQHAGSERALHLSAAGARAARQ
jgi:hypothetical protein